MSWIAIAGRQHDVFDAGGLASANSNPLGSAQAQNAVLERGSLVIETRLSPDGRPQTLMGYQRRDPWKSSFSFQAIPGGGLAVILSQGSNVFHATLNHDASARTDSVRVTYSWDTEKKWARLAAERPEADRVFSTESADPPPLRLDDIREMTKIQSTRHMDEDVLFFAASNDIEPIGPAPTLTENTPILTPDGYRMAGSLKRGDIVQTLEAGPLPVLQTVSRVVPARGSFRPVRLRAPYFGLQQDIIVAPDQRLVIGGSEVEYLFGREHVLVPAGNLVNGISAIRCTGPNTVRYHQLVLPQHESLIAAGCAIESLYIGRIRRKAEHLAASVLHGTNRNDLPEHPRSSYLILKPFESITLAEQRAA